MNKIISKWTLWLFPVIAVIVTGWIFYDFYQKRGAEVEIYFDDALGLQAEKTPVRFRGVTIGLVKSVTITPDTKGVLAKVTLQKEADAFAREGAKFWMVSPQLTFQGVKGLETILEGTYIGALPGKEDSSKHKDFKASLNSEMIDSLENTTAYYIETNTVESINVGNAVTFRGVIVGFITKLSLNKKFQLVTIQFNIQNKYVKLIRDNTVFWRKVGIQANLGLFGSDIKINSLDSIMRGGIEFGTPDRAGTLAKAGARYALSSSTPKDYEKWSPVIE